MSSTQDSTSCHRPSLSVVAEPYRLFFPLGALWGLVGVSFWAFRSYCPGLAVVSPQAHAWVQVYGFMWAFIVGFLATAVPRLTRAASFSLPEVVVLVALTVAAAVSALFAKFTLAHALFFSSAIASGGMLLMRHLRRDRDLPPSFVFLPFAFACACLGSGLKIALAAGVSWRTLALHQLANRLLFEGLVVFMLLGVGGFLIRSILNLPHASMPEPAEPRPAPAPWSARTHAAFGVGILAGFAVDAFYNAAAGGALCAALVTGEALGQMRIHRWPRTGKFGAHWLRASMWLLLAGLWGAALCPAQYRVAVAHIGLIGGFALSVFTIATRVILSHGGFNDRLLKSNGAFVVMALLMILGLLTRCGADLVPEHYQSHLLYASLLWSLGLLVWCVAILGKVRHRPAVEGSGC